MRLLGVSSFIFLYGNGLCVASNFSLLSHFFPECCIPDTKLVIIYLDLDDSDVPSRIIRQHYLFLVDNLDAKHSGLVGELYQAEVLNAEERETITCEVISFTQNWKLLSMLSRKTEDQFDKFLDALDNTGQRHIRNRITGRQSQ